MLIFLLLDTTISTATQVNGGGESEAIVSRTARLQLRLDLHQRVTVIRRDLGEVYDGEDKDA